MSLDSFVRRRIQNRTKRVSAEVTIRRVTRTTGPTPLVNPPDVTGLAVAAATAAGSSTIGLVATAARGRLVQGDQFSVAGDVTIYTIGVPVTAAGNGFAAVPFAPPLAANADQDAAVSLFYAADISVRVRIAAYPMRLIDGSLIQAGDLQIIVPAASIPFEPENTHQVIFDGRTHQIIAVTPERVAEQVGLWRLQCRE